MDVITLCLRYIRSRKIAIVSLVFVAIAVTANIVVIAVMDGFQERIRTHLRGTESDLTIQRGGAAAPPIRHLEWVAEELKGEMAEAGGPIAALAPHLLCLGLIGTRVDLAQLSVEDRLLPIRLIGIDYEREAEVVPFKRILNDLRDEDLHLHMKPEDMENPFRERAIPGLIMGASLAQSLDVQVGSIVQVLTGRLHKQPNGSLDFASQNLPFQVLGCFDSGRDDYDMMFVYVSRPDFVRLSYGDNPPPHSDCRTVQARLKDGVDLNQTVQRLRADHPGLEFQTWEDKNRTLIAAVQSEKAMIVILIFFIIAVAAGSIMGILYMMVIEKTRDIGILRSMGLSRARVVGVFMGCGTILGVLGSSLGLALGVLIVRNINAIKQWLGHHGVEIFSEKIYRFKEIPTKLLPSWVAGTVLVAVGLSILAGVIPAALAARLDPVRCLKDD